MDYVKENWIDVPDPSNPPKGAIPIDAIIMDKIEQGIADAHTEIGNLDESLKGHTHSASDIGLDSVDNTSDMEKPVSTAQGAAIEDAKKAGTAAQADLSSHIADTTKHITETERTKWNNKPDSNHTHDGRYYPRTEVDGKLGGKANLNHTHEDMYYTKTEVTNLLSGKAATLTLTASVNVNGWTDFSGGYKNTVAVSNIAASDNPVADVVLGDNVSNNKKYIEAWECVGRITTANNSVTLYAYDNKPRNTFNIQLKVVR